MLSEDVRYAASNPRPAAAPAAAAAPVAADTQLKHTNMRKTIARRLVDELVTNAPPKDREVEAEKARERSRQRFG